jgi:hypothetical protein
MVLLVFGLHRFDGWGANRPSCPIRITMALADRYSQDEAVRKISDANP